MPLTTLFGANATWAAGGSSHTVIRTDFHEATIEEVLPRTGPGSRQAATHIWWLGNGINSLRQHRLECVFRGAAAEFRTPARVFSSFRAVCPSPAAAALETYLTLTENLTAGKDSPLYYVSLYSFGVPATDDASSQPRQPESEMTGRTVRSRHNFTFHMLQECSLLPRSDCAAHCSQAGPRCFAGILSSTPLSGPRGGGTNVTISGYGFHADLASDVRCRFGDHLEGTEVWARGHILNQTHLLCQSTDLGHMRGQAGQGDYTVQLRVTLNGQDYSAIGWPFFYYRQPRVSHTTAPSFLAADQRWLHRPEFAYGGPQTGGSLMEVHGRDSFRAAELGEALCSFSGVTAAATFVTDSRLRCFAPPLESGALAYTVAVSVVLNGVSAPPAKPAYLAAYVAYRAPQVNLIVPDAAPTRVPVILRIIGAGLKAFVWFPRCSLLADAYPVTTCLFLQKTNADFAGH